MLTETDVTVFGRKKSFQFEVWTNISNKCVIKHSQTERMSNESNLEQARDGEREERRKHDDHKKEAKTSTLARSLAHSLAICNLKTVILPLWNIIYRMVSPIPRTYVCVVRHIVHIHIRKKLFEKHKLICGNQRKTLNAYMCLYVCVGMWASEL